MWTAEQSIFGPVCVSFCREKCMSHLLIRTDRVHS